MVYMYAMTDQERRQIRDVIERRMASFEAAERAVDARGLLQHFSDEGDSQHPQ